MSEVFPDSHYKTQAQVREARRQEFAAMPKAKRSALVSRTVARAYEWGALGHRSPERNEAEFRQAVLACLEEGEWSRGERGINTHVLMCSASRRCDRTAVAAKGGVAL